MLFYRTNSVKVMTKFFFKLKLFLPISLIFGAKKVFPRNQAVMKNFIRVSSNMAKLREISWSNSKKTPWQMSGGKDSKTIFHRILPANARGLTSTTAVDWHLKVKKSVMLVYSKYTTSQPACKKSSAQFINPFSRF